MNTKARTERYNQVAITLHWLIAIFILGLVPVGLWMEDAPKAVQLTVYQMHKSFGLMVLFLSIARLGWRYMNPAPPLPASMKSWEKFAAHGTHIIFYVLIIAIPLSGWMMVSTSPKNIPTMFLTLFNWPHIWFLADIASEHKKALQDSFHEIHELLAFTAIGLLVLHVGAALKHQFINKDEEMVRMIPAMGQSTPPARKPRGVFVVLGGTALLFMAIALLGSRPGDAAPALTAASPASVQGNWLVEPKDSTLSFTFTHVGRSVSGQFTRWQADIEFDPDNLQASHIITHIDLGSAITGDATYDNTLPQADWFDVAGMRNAVFESRDIKIDGKGGYVMSGTLSLRGIKLPMMLPFTLEINGDRAIAKGTASLDRMGFNIGANADATGEFVGKTVQVQLNLSATRRGAP